MTKTTNFFFFGIAIFGLALMSVASTSVAQTVRLTPEQQQMLNQLPPAQRQQALKALEQFNRQGDGNENAQLSSVAEPLEAAPQSTDISAGSTTTVVDELRAEGGTRLIVNLELKEELSDSERAALSSDPALRGVHGSHYYELDESGNLILPGLSTIPLIGLRELQIEQRLGAEPALVIFNAIVSILETKTVGAKALTPFGYDLFEPTGYSFEPVTTGPVPPDYVLGPGDSIRVQLFGNVNGIYEFEVSRDGVLNLPELGPITVAGLPFSEFREDLNRRVREMLIGTQVSVTMGQLRTIRIFVLGDAARPASYVVSSLATMSSALYESGGISTIGSLRNIQLKRDGRVVAKMDLYDLLLNGDTSADQRLQPGDVIFIPPIGDVVGVAGAVRRPAIYELKGDASVADVVQIAGGLLPKAFPGGARIERISADKQRVVISVDADGSDGASMRVWAGDTLVIPEVLDELSDSVVLMGHVQRPGPYQWRDGMRLTQLIPSAQHLNPGADADYIMVRRETESDRRVHVVSANLSMAWANPGSADDVALQARDTVHVFSLAFGRHRILQPILDELKLQSQFSEPYREVSVTGQVKAPGTYPLEPGMRVSDLIRAGGNLSEEAYALKAELARYEVVNDEYRATEVIDVDLNAILSGTESADLILGEHDNLRISMIPKWDSLWSVTLAGEVKFPGAYRLQRGETLRHVLDRAGGLSDEAFPQGAIFLREALRKREQEQIEVLARRLEADLTSLSLETADTTGSQTLATGRELLTQLRATEAVGRLVIDLDQLASYAQNANLVIDVELRDGDRLLVPKRPQEVTVIGETQQNASHLFQPGLSREDYIDMSGGLTRRADSKLIYVVRASGAVVAGNRSKWFGRSSGTEIRPGDTIVVPLETDRMRPLTFWGNVTQILYQGAIAVAAIQTFND